MVDQLAAGDWVMVCATKAIGSHRVGRVRSVDPRVTATSPCPCCGLGVGVVFEDENTIYGFAPAELLRLDRAPARR